LRAGGLQNRWWRAFFQTSAGVAHDPTTTNETLAHDLAQKPGRRV
jgi:hypothetical protein